ncbi:MAG: GerW family sporulation protein [Lachnospiraceae bacterium]|nr:GerW family sporulation protein [Lachnospiraceae bacterium]
MGDFSSTVQSLFKGMDGFLTTKTVVGDAVKFDDGTIILPLVDVSFGVAAGAFSEPGKKENGAGGMGGKVQPSAILVIKDGQSKLVNVKNQDGITKILDMVPELIDKYGKKKKNKDADEEDYGYDDYDEDYDEEDYADVEEEQEQ